MSDYLSDEEQVARLQGWWRSNGLMTIIAVVLAIAAVVGWRWYQSQQAEAIAAASDLYTTYSEADDSSRAASLTRLLGEHPNSTYAQFALMDQAKRATTAGNLDEAVKHYQDVLTKKPEDVIADLANVRLARLLQQQDKSDAALAALASVRTSGFRAQVAELKGDILLQQGDRSGAHEAYVAALAASTSGEERPVLKMKENATSTQVAAVATEPQVDSGSVSTEVVVEVAEEVATEISGEISEDASEATTSSDTPSN